MKRLFRVLLIIIIMTFGSSLCSDATTSASVKLISNKDIIENGEQVEISFNIDGQKTAAYLAHIYFDDTKFDYVSGPENAVIDKNHIKIIWYDTLRRSYSQRGRT